MSSGFKQMERKSKIKDKKSKLQVKKQKCSARLPPCATMGLHDLKRSHYDCVWNLANEIAALRSQ